MIGKINNSPSFSSRVILKGFGTNNYKKIKMKGYNSTYVESTKAAIESMKNNNEDNVVTLTYDELRGTMSVSIEKKIDGHNYAGGPLYFFPNISNIERMYQRVKNDMEFQS